MSLALYRKYRPGTFAEVKGQEHVTEPLRQALRSGRINHAYLFSGPRGCGKTSSARILARSLNCEKGPTPDPCGECESCVALAPTGPGHLDVIEIDAASHGGVDDARDLRERAFFAPVSARYKIYIIDEAHMVTREGFNALLKLVEEPPPHLKFVFATTEPEKVIGTIKSRTHHYPFRLIPPTALRTLMEEILTSEDVPFEPAALPLVVRAGAGSARDSLSILDQLYAGSDESGITYARAVSLLGYTDGDLLDDVVGAFAARDGAAVFQAVNRVAEGGHDPRRFAMDLLERFRDLVILANVPEAASSGLLDRPADELERLQAQAASMGPADLTRAAEVFNTGLIEMRGAASPRLLLELMCARVLLPGAAQGEAALLARLERLERSGPAAAPSAPAAYAPSAHVQPAPVPAVHTQTATEVHAQQAPAYAPPSAPSAPPGSGHPASPAPVGAVPGGQDSGGTAAHTGAAPGSAAPASPAPAAGADDDWPAAVRPGAGPVESRTQTQTQTRTRPEQASAAPASGAEAGAVQQAWPQVLEGVKRRSKVAWSQVSENARLVGVEGRIVTLGFLHPGAMRSFVNGGKDAVIAEALQEALGGTWKVEAVVGGSGGAPAFGGGRPSAPAAPPQPPAPRQEPDMSRPAPQASVPAPAGAPEQEARPAPGGQDARVSAGGPQAPQTPQAGTAQAPQGGGTATARPATDESWPDEPMPDDPGSPPAPGPGLAAARSAARAAAQSGPRPGGNRPGGGNAAWPDAIPGRAPVSESDEVDPLNDADADVDALTGMALIQRELGGRVIEEIDHS
ncbi:DNA polymerase III subunit gamma and tau [Planomonospora venezuelensis]|uniref:DNA polymerase III subunit gamma/tau n=1 Tax=Planomonospora venezuelensis TaxID=1999 RepID=A0A841DFC9_PLAVE|nr:DNA polymerase III subunit gamma and tau [Planomonospora venezuelensis]MBB5966785.1 DNA polymerase-3 subunit gamma/tau [Planomonospora venezuelensis]GIN01712.1 DNA polymerase III subunit gamma and tau [Planomonospora venezuelensis]